MNKVVLSGRLTKEPELRKTGSGNSMVTFCMAVRNSAEKVYFLDCWAYERLADLIYENVTKGEKITVMGKVTQRTYTGSDGRTHNVIEIFVEEAEFQLKLVEREEVEPVFPDVDEVAEEPKPKKPKTGKKSTKKSKKDDLPF